MLLRVLRGGKQILVELTIFIASAFCSKDTTVTVFVVKYCTVDSQGTTTYFDAQTVGRQVIQNQYVRTIPAAKYVKSLVIYRGRKNVHTMTINTKQDKWPEMRQKGRFAGFSLYISNNDVLSIDAIQGSRMCYKDGPQLPPLNFTTTCTEYGRYVIFYNERRTGTPYPEGYEVGNVFTELCEVSVEGKLCYNFRPRYVF